MQSWRRILLGSPIPRANLAEQSLSKIKALAILSSDALSSVAYATEEILTVLVFAGAAALSHMPHIAIMIALLILIVGVSYRQAIHAYPRGGGAYTVARENFGVSISLIAAASLMIDYILTVAVSVTAGIFAMTSAFPVLVSHSVLLSVLGVILITWINLRGVRDSASAFAAPTYFFIGLILLMMGVGLFHFLRHDLTPIHYAADSAFYNIGMPQTLTILLILRAFSSGCSAMTGIEAVSNSVTVFNQPMTENAEKTLMWLMITLIVLFLGVTFLASGLQIQPLTSESVLSQIAHALFGNNIFYYGLQVSTCLILLLAANTSFAGFPRLASLIAQDGYLPRPLQSLGDRLAFSNGIIILAFLSIILIILFNANTNALIPLYSIGVFLAFTICQAGLTKVWWKRRNKGWARKLIINALGAVATGIAVVVILDSKFSEGAWIFALAVPCMIMMFYKIHRHYKRADKELALTYAEMTGQEEIGGAPAPHSPLKVIVPLSKLHKGSLAALDFAYRISPKTMGLCIDIGDTDVKKLRTDWARCGFPTDQLVVIESKYRSVITPLLEYIQKMDKANPDEGLAALVIPKAQTRRWWQNLLHNNYTLMLRHALYELSRMEYQGTVRVIVEVPYQLHD